MTDICVHGIRQFSRKIDELIRQVVRLEQVLFCRSVSESSFAWEPVKPDDSLGLMVLQAGGNASSVWCGTTIGCPAKNRISRGCEPSLNE